MSYEALALKRRIQIALLNMFRLVDKHLAAMGSAYKTQFAAAFFQGVAETYAIENDVELANNAAELSVAFARYGYDRVLEAHTKELAK